MINTFNLDNLNTNDSNRLNEIFSEKRKAYTLFVDELSQKYGKNPYWWSTNFASRDILASDAYRNICLLFLAMEKARRNEEIEVIEISKSYGVLDALIYNLSNYDIEVCCKKRKKKVSGALLEKVMYWYSEIRKFAYIKLKTKGLPKKKNINCLIETDAFPFTFDAKGEFFCRDFKNIEKYTDMDITYLPYYFADDFVTYKQLINHIVECKNTQFLLREMYLSWGNFISLIFYKRKIKKFRQKELFFEGVDVSSIVNYDLFCNVRAGYLAIENYIMMQNLSLSGVEIERLIGWYEGQPCSLDLYMGFHDFFKDGNCIGYEGAPINSNMMSIAPSKTQNQMGAAPDKIAVIGKPYIDFVKMFDESTKVVLVPAFRIDAFFDNNKELLLDLQQKNTTTILVILSYDVGISSEMLQVLSEVMDELCEYDKYNILLKNHPNNLKLRLHEYGIKQVKYKYEFVDGKLTEFARKSDYVLLTPSSSVVEIVAIAIPCIAYTPNGVIKYNYLDEMDQSYVQNVSSAQEIIQLLKGGKKDKISAAYIRNKYFEPINKAAVANLFI